MLDIFKTTKKQRELKMDLDNIIPITISIAMISGISFMFYEIYNNFKMAKKEREIREKFYKKEREKDKYGL
jgi:hypothetical protein